MGVNIKRDYEKIIKRMFPAINETKMLNTPKQPKKKLLFIYLLRKCFISTIPKRKKDKMKMQKKIVYLLHLDHVKII